MVRPPWKTAKMIATLAACLKSIPFRTTPYDIETANVSNDKPRPITNNVK
jgi:hypothetical protein